MTEQDVKALHARVEAAEQRAKAVQILVGSTQMNIIYLLEPRMVDGLKMAELRSRAQDIEAKLMRNLSMPPKEQPLSQEDIEKLIDQRVANAIGAIAIYETKTRVARDSMDQVVCQGVKATKDASN
ncbi:hypothetical protein Tco_0679414 [Tanacetum coccineum]|uniref:Uncharacterized protein n=1 Tax=Tanacetum coccineum TaxID=301880 RepID=A0ABQ4XIJ3_9ASTR